MRKPLLQCPLCDGRGAIQANLYNNVGGVEWVAVKTIDSKHVPGKRKVLMAESPRSKLRRAAWMHAQETRTEQCPCTFWRKEKHFHRRLWEMREYMLGVEQNKPINIDDFDWEFGDQIDDLFVS